MKNIRKKIDNRWFIFLLLFIITICGISYSRIRKKTILNFGREKDFTEAQLTLNALDAITVEIEGEVKYPGIYTISEGYTLENVIEKAGGLTEYADVISLDWNVFDGQRIVIPKREEAFVIEYSIPFLEQKQQQKEQEEILEEQEKHISDDTKRLYVNINTADIEELSLLPGIGEKIAENIISYRTDNGLFQSIEEIKNVPKIGNSIFEKIKNYITIQ